MQGRPRSARWARTLSQARTGQALRLGAEQSEPLSEQSRGGWLASLSASLLASEESESGARKQEGLAPTPWDWPKATIPTVSPTRMGSSVPWAWITLGRTVRCQNDIYNTPVSSVWGLRRCCRERRTPSARDGQQVLRKEEPTPLGLGRLTAGGADKGTTEFCLGEEKTQAPLFTV